MLHCPLKVYLPRQKKRSTYADAAVLSTMVPLLVCDCRKNSDPSSILALNCKARMKPKNQGSQSQVGTQLPSHDEGVMQRLLNSYKPIMSHDPQEDTVSTP